MGYIGQAPANKAVKTADIEDSAITAAKIADGTVVAGELASDSVTTAKILNANVTTAKLAADAVDGTKLADDAVGAEHIADNAVGLAALASGTDGNIISYDASGNPVAIATGSDGQVLTSAGAGQPPAFEAVSGGVDTSGTPANNQLAIFTDADTIEGDSQVTFDGSKLVVGGADIQVYTSGKGIDFSQTAAPTRGSSTSEILKDYEEGTWTASFSFSSGSSGIRSDSETCSYTKIGRLVTLTGAVVNTSVSSPSGGFYIEGVPYNSDSGTGDMAERSVGAMSPWTATGTLRNAVIIMFSGGSNLNIQDAESRANNEADHCTNDAEWRFAISYITPEL